VNVISISLDLAGSVSICHRVLMSQLKRTSRGGS